MQSVQLPSDFELLVDRLADFEPRFGFSDVLQVPELKDHELAAVALEAPAYALDMLDEKFVAELAELLKQSRHPGVTPDAVAKLVGVHVIAKLREHLALPLLEALQRECAMRGHVPADVEVDV